MEINSKTGEPVWVFPFEGMGPGCSFFIPTLHPKEMAKIVASRAQSAGARVKAYPTVHDNVLGVRVWRVP